MEIQPLPIISDERARQLVAPLLPWPSGLRRGATVAAVGSTSLLMTLLSTAMTQGAWAAIVGLPAFGALAVGQDFQIPLDRLEDGGFADSGGCTTVNPRVAKAL